MVGDMFMAGHDAMNRGRQQALSSDTAERFQPRLVLGCQEQAAPSLIAPGIRESWNVLLHCSGTIPRGLGCRGRAATAVTEPFWGREPWPSPTSTAPAA